MIYDESSFAGLIEFSKKYSDSLKALNSTTLQLMQSDGIQALKALSLATNQLGALVDPSIFGTFYKIGDSIAKISSANQSVLRSIEAVADKYKELFGIYSSAALTESLKTTIEQVQLSSIAQLCAVYETPMIRDLKGCFVNAQYEYLPDIFNKALQGPTIGAADVAFIKTGSIIPVIDSQLIYPRGLKTSLETLNRSTAENISDNAEIIYDTKNNSFISNDSKINSKGMNIVCAGIEVMGSGELFTEVELIDFISFLSRTPTMGARADVGKRIYDWIDGMYKEKNNMMSFDRDVYYHCRSRKSDSMPYTFDEMLKAPYGLPGAGRFNQVGRAHFYFSNTKNGAEVEVKKHLKRDEVLQTVKIKPVKGAKLLDLSKTLRRGASFLKMIRFPLSDDNNKMPKEYLLPCYVADCCQLIGFDGIKYYGSKEYDNYVSWTDGYFEDAGMCS